MIEKIVEFIKEKPKRVFYIMVLVIILNSIFAVVKHVTRKPAEPIKVEHPTGIDPLMKGVTGIMDISSHLKNVKSLENEILRILDKDSLTRQDSLRIIELGEEIENVRQFINNNR